MTKYRYYITDLFEGCVKGTNSDEMAAYYAQCEDYFVVDSETGEWVQLDGERSPVQPAE